MDDATPSARTPDSTLTTAAASANGSTAAIYATGDDAVVKAEAVAFLALAGELAAGLKVLAVGIDAGRLAGIAEQIDAVAFDELDAVESGGYGLVMADYQADDADRSGSVEELTRAADLKDGLVLARIPNNGEFSGVLDALTAEFPQCLVYRQHNWVASAVFDDSMFSAEEPGRAAAAVVRKTAGPPAGGELYAIVLAGHGKLPATRAQLAVTRSPRLRELTDEIHALRTAAASAAAAAQTEREVQTERIRELSEQIAWFDEYELNLREEFERHSWAMALLTLWRGAVVTLRRIKRVLNR